MCDAVLFERKTALLLIVVMCVADVDVYDMVMVMISFLLLIFPLFSFYLSELYYHQCIF